MSFSEPMRRVDAAWLRMDRPENTADIVALLRMTEPLPFARFRTLIEERLLAFRRFCQRIRDPGVGAAGWEDDPSFRLARHLERVELQADAGALRDHLGKLASASFEPDRPPWRMQLLSLGRRRSAMAVKLHHCMGDGRALVRVLLGLADEGAPAPAAPGAAYRALQIARAPIEVARMALTEPVRAASEVGAFATSLARLATLSLDRTPGLVQPLTGARRVDWTPAVTLSGAAEVAHHEGVTVNELLMAAIAGGLRRVLPEAAAGAAGPRAMVPVDARAAADATMGNAFGLVFLELPTDVATPAARIAAVHERFERIRNSPDAAVTLAVLAGFGLLPRPLEQLGTGFFSRKASLVVTNVRGPPAPMRLGGAEVDRMMFWVPHPATLGLGVSILSYAGTLRVGVRADAGLRVAPTALTAAIAEELKVLGVPVAPGEAPRRRRTGLLSRAAPLPVHGLA